VFQVHGNINTMRCTRDVVCGAKSDIPDDRAEDEPLRCPKCNALTRPHILWFDESYDELNYYF
jgi:NAD-dependent deacetylase